VKSYAHLLEKGWFRENPTLWEGQAFTLEVEEVLFEGKSDFQHVLIFQSKSYGKVLVLDGVIQLTERDEFAYQEMISFLPLLAHPNPKSVVVIGGGDGAVLSQLVKDQTLESVTLCEIDSLVISKSKEHFPQFSRGWNDSRVTVQVGDGLAYLKENKVKADVIVVDSSDPVGPAETLFTQEFYELMKNTLNEGGIICTQGECMWLHLDLIRKCMDKNRKLYNNVHYGYTTIPTYPSGQIGFLVCSNTHNCSAPVRTPADAMTALDADSLRYYSSDIHRAAFVLPAFCQKALHS